METGFVSQDCECVVTQPCGMSVGINSSPDDGTGIGMLESSVTGGTEPDPVKSLNRCQEEEERL